MAIVKAEVYELFPGVGVAPSACHRPSEKLLEPKDKAQKDVEFLGAFADLIDGLSESKNRTVLDVLKGFGSTKTVSGDLLFKNGRAPTLPELIDAQTSGKIFVGEEVISGKAAGKPGRMPFNVIITRPEAKGCAAKTTHSAVLADAKDVAGGANKHADRGQGSVSDLYMDPWRATATGNQADSRVFSPRGTLYHELLHALRSAVGMNVKQKGGTYSLSGPQAYKTYFSTHTAMKAGDFVSYNEELEEQIIGSSRAVYRAQGLESVEKSYVTELKKLQSSARDQKDTWNGSIKIAESLAGHSWEGDVREFRAGYHDPQRCGYYEITLNGWNLKEDVPVDLLRTKTKGGEKGKAYEAVSLRVEPLPSGAAKDTGFLSKVNEARVSRR
ncbi:hypothetical protein [Streptomyces klenkii]|uniref:hypothetical protein n=1 Tax=Streptomyces klenkii TaxID=1420899 RepID=UPI0011C40055|nr:hypothetical protein [Streptomyces klenkii]